MRYDIIEGAALYHNYDLDAAAKRFRPGSIAVPVGSLSHPRLVLAKNHIGGQVWVEHKGPKENQKRADEAARDARTPRRDGFYVAADGSIVDWTVAWTGRHVAMHVRLRTPGQSPASGLKTASVVASDEINDFIETLTGPFAPDAEVATAHDRLRTAALLILHAYLNTPE